MTDWRANFGPERVRQYLEHGPPAFTPGHAGLMRMLSVLLAERVAVDGEVLIVGVGGGIETRYLASDEPGWRFVGVDPSPAMLDLARATAGHVAGDRMTLIEGTVSNAPSGPFDAATCILVLGLVSDDGGKLDLLTQVRRRLKPTAPFVLVDQCLDRAAPDFEQRLERYASYASRSGVDAETVSRAKAAIRSLDSMVPASRNEQLLDEAGFRQTEVFYTGMAWRGWLAYA